jgi:hypothetical protein
MREHEVASCWTGSLSTDVASFRVHVEEEILDINLQLPRLDRFIWKFMESVMVCFCKDVIKRKKMQDSIPSSKLVSYCHVVNKIPQSYDSVISRNDIQILVFLRKNIDWKEKKAQKFPHTRATTYAIPGLTCRHLIKKSGTVGMSQTEYYSQIPKFGWFTGYLNNILHVQKYAET